MSLQEWLDMCTTLPWRNLYILPPPISFMNEVAEDLHELAVHCQLGPYRRVFSHKLASDHAQVPATHRARSMALELFPMLSRASLIVNLRHFRRFHFPGDTTVRYATLAPTL